MSADDQTALIFGKYKLLERLGRGGMAEVFKALSVGAAGFQRPVVIKRILPHLAADAQFVEMFIEEARIAASLDHPNIVQVFDLGRHAGDLFMVLEYVPGSDLGELARFHATEGQPIPHQLVAFIAVDLCKALECAHGHRDEHGHHRPVIHRDVSPQNVLLSVGGGVKLADFGLATSMGAARVTMPGVIKGKLGYMSPEQAGGARDLDVRSDLFSLGIVMYEALSGRRLFVGHGPADTIRRVRAAQVPPLGDVAPGVPTPLGDLVSRLLARSRDDRPESSQEVRRVLATYLRGVSPPVDATVLAEAVRRVLAGQSRAVDAGDSDAETRAVESEEGPCVDEGARDASYDIADDGRMTFCDSPDPPGAATLADEGPAVAPVTPLLPPVEGNAAEEGSVLVSRVVTVGNAEGEGGAGT